MIPFFVCTLRDFKMRVHVVGLILLCGLVAGCSNHSSNIRVGNDLPDINVGNLRDAIRTVRVYPSVPAGAVEVGQLSASRCHRNFLDEAPTDEAVLIDLKVSAYAQGADGLTQVSYKKESGLSSNCWQILTGTATVFTVQHSPNNN